MSTFPGFDKPINKYKVVELKSFLRERGLKVSGLKHQLINRLTTALEEENDSDYSTEDNTYDNDDTDSDHSTNDADDYTSDYSSQNNSSHSSSESDIEILTDNSKNNTQYTSQIKQITTQNNCHNNINNSHNLHINTQPLKTPFHQNQHFTFNAPQSTIMPPHFQHNSLHNLHLNGYHHYHHNSYVAPVSYKPYNPQQCPAYISNGYINNNNYISNHNHIHPMVQYKPKVMHPIPDEYINNINSLGEGSECKIYSETFNKWFIGKIIKTYYDIYGKKDYLLVEYDNKRRQKDVYRYSDDIKCLSIFDKSYPNSTLLNSHFLKLYDNANSNNIPITVQTIRNCLPYDLQIKMDNDMKLKGVTNIKQICIWLWSLGSMSSGLYKSINISLYKDDKQQIERFLPIIRGLNQYLVREITHRMVTWRGSKMSSAHFAMYKEHKRYRCPAIGATSLDYYEAKKFKHKYMIKFIIPIGSWNAAEITPYSQYKKEKEVAFPPYTAFEVLSINRHDNLITVKVLDNKKVSLDVPSVFI